MNSPVVLDVDFGISQLSGNKALLLTLLRKFADEYRQTEPKLKDLCEALKWEEARVLVHTLKGVAGNLGCNALHLSCKAIEAEIKTAQVFPVGFDGFIDVLNETLSTIDALSNEEQLSAAKPAAQQENTASSDAAKHELMSALKANEFIPPNRLADLLEQTCSDEAQREAIQDAVDELDYGIAIELVNKIK